jgi:small GTP-binding protein
MSRTLVLVVIGDGNVGKTGLLVVYAKGRFVVEFVPSVFEIYKRKVSVKNKERTVKLSEYAGRGDLLYLRQLSYPDTAVFLVCFSIADRSSFEHVKKIWIDEIKEYVPDPLCLLVGTKADLREGAEAAVSNAEGLLLTRNIGAFAYMECSAIRCEGVKEVFEAAILQVLHPPAQGGCRARCSVQ